MEQNWRANSSFSVNGKIKLNIAATKLAKPYKKLAVFSPTTYFFVKTTSSISFSYFRYNFLEWFKSIINF